MALSVHIKKKLKDFELAVTLIWRKELLDFLVLPGVGRV